MHRRGLIALIFLPCSAFIAGQKAGPVTDVLGAHMNSGRGCSACHAAHSGSAGNGSAKSADASAGSNMLWGEDVSSLYGKTIATGGGAYVEVLPTSLSANTPDVEGMLTCLSCHDGNYASSAMMKNGVYETLPATYGTQNTVPTMFGTRIGGSSSYLSDHPMGLSAKLNCGGGGANWDCAQTNGKILMTGAMSSRFVTNYGFFVQPGVYNNTAVVLCTTCHDPHTMNVVNITASSQSGLPKGTYPTMFFLRAPYNPSNTNPNSNSTSQFCRQCHADKSNEMNGGSAGTVI